MIKNVLITVSGGGEMYKALIIDDELEAIESVYKAFDWNSLHITDVVKISEPHGLVERIASETPEVVFIDIEMGVVSGLDVIEACSTLLPETMFVIISGHDNFEYARTSIKLDVAYYLLKPFTEYEVDNATEKIMNGLNVNYIKDENGEHQGILNVHTRLKLTYGAECGISAFSTPGEGTEMVITIKQS